MQYENTYSRHDKSCAFGVGVFGDYLEVGKQSMLQPIHFRKDLKKIFPEMYGLLTVFEINAKNTSTEGSTLIVATITCTSLFLVRAPFEIPILYVKEPSLYGVIPLWGPSRQRRQN